MPKIYNVSGAVLLVEFEGARREVLPGSFLEVDENTAKELETRPAFSRDPAGKMKPKPPVVDARAAAHFAKVRESKAASAAPVRRSPGEESTQ